MRRPLIGLVILALLLVGGWLLFQRELGARLYAQAVEARAGGDSTRDLPDGLHLYLCGTGSPLPDAGRAGPCAAVIAGRQIYVVDSGEGASRKLGLGQIPVARINGLLLTHFHSDHIDGIGPLMLLRWTQGTTTSPLPIHGPTGVEAVVAGFNAAYATDNGYRVGHHGERIVPPGGAGGVAMPFAEPPADGTPVVLLERDGLTITAFRVDHGPVDPAVGYRFDYRGRSIVISGDTAASPNIVRNARGADLLLHEALQPAMVGPMTRALDARGQANVAQITRDILNYHASPEDAAKAAKAAGVRQLVLTHLVPPLPSSAFYAAFLGDAVDDFDGPIIVGEDGMLFSLPAGSEVIEREDLL
ncbi:MBL fold metallo-hydrolase [Sphingomonas lacunae]|uniref:MBL fold metallo-hydrolase n=2 Tax=Sphingomonas lacunae TaxID=2698828 RepID=A0A6M4B063_9SPHN|nr:MBL fold metallo-hydrolase [Sphingomonas lacunae]